MVVFAASHFEGSVQDWWVHHWESYWTKDEGNDELPWYCYPSWGDFMDQVKKQFCDSAIKEVHEKRMNELRMGSNPATVYFQKLEQEAKLAGR